MNKGFTVGRAAPAALSPLTTTTYVNLKKHGHYACNPKIIRYNLGMFGSIEECTSCDWDTLSLSPNWATLRCWKCGKTRTVSTHDE